MRKVIISHDIPPIYQQLHDKFGVEWESGLIIAFDGKIHSSGEIDPQKVIHECQHLDRQAELGNEAWWNLYLDSDIFRFDEEVLAYVAEAKFIKKNIKDRELRNKILIDVAKTFSSGMYGNLLTTQEALRILTK